MAAGKQAKPLGGISGLRWLLLAYIVFTASLCYVLILKGSQSAPPFAFGGWRTVIGGLAVLIFARTFGKPILPEKRLWCWVPLVALTATTLTFGFMFLSPKFAGAGLASILGNAQPLFIALFAGFILGEGLSRTRVAGLILGIVGIIIIVSPSFRGGSADGVSLGAGLALLTSLSAAMGTVLARFLKLGHSLLAFTGWQLVLGGSLLLGLSSLTGEAPIRWNWTFSGILLFLAVFNTAVVTCAWFYLLQHEKAGKLGIYLFLTPVFGVGWAVVFGDKGLTLTSLAGGLFVLAAVLMQEFEGFVRSEPTKSHI